MKRAIKDVLYFETGPDNAPTLFVEPGEEFEVVTQMNRGPWIEGHPDQAELEARVTGGNPSSGAIYVNGAAPGQVLIVHVLDIQTEPFGFTRFSGSTGAMPGWMGGTGIGHHEKIVQISDGLIHWSDELKFPVEPMLGVVGVAPARSRWTNAWAGEWGWQLRHPGGHRRSVCPHPDPGSGSAAAHRRHARAPGRRRDMRSRGDRDRRYGQNPVRARPHAGQHDLAPH